MFIFHLFLFPPVYCLTFQGISCIGHSLFLCTFSDIKNSLDLKQPMVCYVRVWLSSKNGWLHLHESIPLTIFHWSIGIIYIIIPNIVIFSRSIIGYHRCTSNYLWSWRRTLSGWFTDPEAPAIADPIFGSGAVLL